MHVVNNISTAGDVKATGEVISKDTMRAEKDIKVAGNVSVQGNISVEGITNLKGGVIVPTIFLGTTSASFPISTAQQGTTKILAFGYGPAYPTGGIANPCVAPYTGPSTASFLGRSIITTALPSQPVFDFRNDGSNATIDYGFDYVQFPNNNSTARTGPSITPILKINGACYGDVEIAKGGGFASTGDHFEVGSPISTYSITSNIYGRAYVAQRVTLNSSVPDTYMGGNPALNRYNTQLFVSKNKTKALSVFNTVTNPSGEEVFMLLGDGSITTKVSGTNVKALSISNPTLNKEVFQIKNNGATYIGVEKVNAGPHSDAMLTVSGKVACKEVRVFNNTSGYWADFVFDKEYKLMPLMDVEKYYNIYNHLPNIPTAQQIMENGNDLGKTDALLLQKIEELTIYLVQQQKEIEALKKQINK